MKIEDILEGRWFPPNLSLLVNSPENDYLFPPLDKPNDHIAIQKTSFIKE